MVSAGGLFHICRNFIGEFFFTGAPIECPLHDNGSISPFFRYRFATAAAPRLQKKPTSDEQLTNHFRFTKQIGTALAIQY
jgi:hypothetical protein